MLASQRRDVFAKLAQLKWSNLLAAGVDWLVTSYRERNAALLRNAYSNVSVRVAANTVGLEPDAAVAYLVAHGWTLEADVLVAPAPAPLDAAAQAALTKMQDISAEQVARLAEQVLFTEQ
jgi:hypothetical protein